MQFGPGTSTLVELTHKGEPIVVNATKIIAMKEAKKPPGALLVFGKEHLQLVDEDLATATVRWNNALSSSLALKG